MTSDIVSTLEHRWNTLRPEVLDRDEVDISDRKKLKELLLECTEAGKEVANPAKRMTLQWIARDIADAIFLFSRSYPDAVILPPKVTQRIPERKVDISRLPSSGGNLFGREGELKLLDKAWANPSINVVVLVAWGGVGKTALVNSWLAKMAKKKWRGADRVFAWTFAGQGIERATVFAETFLNEALDWFGDNAGRSITAEENSKRLVGAMQRYRTLLILDGLEPLQFPPGPKEDQFRVPALRTMIRSLAAENPGLCVITTRQKIKDIDDFRDATALQIDLGNLSTQAGARFLNALGVEGTDDERHSASDEVKGHALALRLLGTYLRDVCGGDVMRRSELKFFGEGIEPEGVVKRVMESYEDWFSQEPPEILNVLRLLGLFDRAATAEEIGELRKEPIITGVNEALVPLTEQRWQMTLARLRRSGLLAAAKRTAPNELDVHPLVRNYFANQVRQEHPDGWRQGHLRLFDYLKTAAPQRPENDKEVNPLFAAVYHGCEAGEHIATLKEVLQPRILRWDEITQPRFFSTNTLGRWGDTLEAMRLYFKTPWKEVLDTFVDQDKAFIFTAAATCLRTQCLFQDSIAATNKGLELRIKDKEWDKAATALRMLNQIYIALGDLEKAMDCGFQSVELADKSGSVNEKECARARYGESLYHAGKYEEARRQFVEYIQLTADRTGGGDREKNQQFCLIDGFSEFEYCSLLFTEGEYSAAQTRASAVLEQQRVLEQESRVRSQIIPLWRGLSNLILGRIDMLKACNSPNDSKEKAVLFARVGNHFDAAVNDLGKADERQHIPLGFLARAELNCYMQKLDSAARDLEQALQTCEIHEMRLLEADCHLVYVKYHLASKDMARACESLEKARGLIKRYNYRRREKDISELAKLVAS